MNNTSQIWESLKIVAREGLKWSREPEMERDVWEPRLEQGSPSKPHDGMMLFQYAKTWLDNAAHAAFGVPAGFMFENLDPDSRDKTLQCYSNWPYILLDPVCGEFDHYDSNFRFRQKTTGHEAWEAVEIVGRTYSQETGDSADLDSGWWLLHFECDAVTGFGSADNDEFSVSVQGRLTGFLAVDGDQPSSIMDIWVASHVRRTGVATDLVARARGLWGASLPFAGPYTAAGEALVHAIENPGSNGRMRYSVGEEQP